MKKFLFLLLVAVSAHAGNLTVSNYGQSASSFSFTGTLSNVVDGFVMVLPSGGSWSFPRFDSYGDSNWQCSVGSTTVVASDVAGDVELLATGGEISSGRVIVRSEPFSGMKSFMAGMSFVLVPALFMLGLRWYRRLTVPLSVE